jgi:hypothetical protein
VSELVLDDDRLVVRFSTAEKILGAVRDVSVPRSAITSAARLQSWAEVRGLRVGLGLPRRRKLGTWRSGGHTQLVDLRRDVPALHLRLAGERYDEILVSTPDAARLADELAG